MDQLNMGKNCSSEDWTNEKHSDYLSLMEASFVRAMFERRSRVNNNDNVDRNRNHNHNHNHNNTRKSTRPDRFVLDISESTLDSKPRKFTGPDTATTFTSTTQRQRRPPHRPYKTIYDQVVPELEKKASDKGGN